MAGTLSPARLQHMQRGTGLLAASLKRKPRIVPKAMWSM